MDLRRGVKDPWLWAEVLLLALVLWGVPVLARSKVAGGVFAGYSRPSVRLAGVGLGLVALALLTWAVQSRRDTPGIEPFSRGEMVTGGPYALVRHPIYLALLLGLSGYTLAVANPKILPIVALVTLLFFYLKARADELWLRHRFRTYAQYAREVPLLFPHFPRFRRLPFRRK